MDEENANVFEVHKDSNGKDTDPVFGSKEENHKNVHWSHLFYKDNSSSYHNLTEDIFSKNFIDWFNRSEG